jgi:hypothetical protein
MNQTWKAVVGIVLIFILGWFGGALTTLIIARHKALLTLQHKPQDITMTVERQTTRNLGLNDQQQTQIRTLMEKNVEQRIDLQKQLQPQVRTINQQTLQEINALLTPDQQQRFRDNLIRFKLRFGRNPFNVSAEDAPGGAVTPAAAESLGSGTNAPAAAK